MDTLLTPVMARTLSALVLCWCLVRVTANQEPQPAIVRELVDDGDPPTALLDSEKYGTVRSADYPVEVSGLEWLAAVTAQRGYQVEGLSEKCQEDMKMYWNGLSNGADWASKMYDATGRYASQLLFGNTFWLGSLSLCDEIRPQDFNVSFRVVKMQVSLPINARQTTKLIFLGVCHPSSCSSNDTQIMLTSWTTRLYSQQTSNSTSLAVLSVRNVPGTYSVLNDRRFQAISGTILVVACLVFVGSLYEHFNHPENKVKNDEKNTQNDSGKATETKENQASLQHKESLELEEKNKEKKDENPRRQNGPAAEFLLAFSALRNGKQIFSSKNQKDGSLDSVHGLRFFSLTWVILVHTYLQFFAVGGNKMIREITERVFMFQAIGNATFSVDTFFFISGVLVTYLYPTKPKSNNKQSFSLNILEFVKFMLYRIIRLTPVYLVVVGIVQQSMSYIRNSSVFEPNIIDHYTCAHYWWRNILYINNFYPRTEMCMLWSWYLSVDTQFFTLGAITLIMAKSRFKLAVGTLTAVLISSWCATAIVSYTNQYQAVVNEPFLLFDELYDKPWTRIGPYIVGMGTGRLLKRIGKNLQLPRVLIFLGWAVSLSGLTSIVFGLGSGLSVALSAVYVSLSHTAWGLCLAWIVVACHTGHGGVINSIISNRMLFPLSRLTFCAYLIHPAILNLTGYVLDGPFHFHNGLIVIIFLGSTVASFLLAFLLSIGFEAPVVRLLKLLMK